MTVWSWLVGIAGKDVRALGWISVGAGLCCAWLVAVVVGTIFGAAVRGAKAGCVKDEEENYAGVESAAVLLAGLGFVLTPGLLIAATLVAWLAVGVLPAVLIAGCLRMRWLVGRKAIWSAFGGWALAVAVTATVAFTSDWLNEGRAANRIVARISENAEEGGKIAIVSDGTMDERELNSAEELAVKAGVPKGESASIEIDRVRLLKARGDMEHFKIAMRRLRRREGLAAAQREDVKAMDR